MRKLLSILFVMALTASLAACGKTGAATDAPAAGTVAQAEQDFREMVEKPVTNYQFNDYADCITYNTPLTNTYNKLTNDKELTVVYFGGSLTDGYGCSDKEKFSWRALSGEWLKQNFPDANINLVDTSIGESGTYLGTYRVQKDIIGSKPDLLFIEYAINDNYSGATKEAAASRFETIVREVRTALPTCDIVTVLTTDRHQMPTTQELGLFATAQGHMDIATAYHLPVINIGAGLTRNLTKVEGETWWEKQDVWCKYFINWGDAVHPIDAGHNQYYLCVKEYLENSLKGTDYTGLNSAERQMPAVVSDTLLDGNRTEYGGEALKAHFVADQSSGVTYNSGHFTSSTSQTPHIGYLEMKAGSTLTLTFTGTELALWHNLASFQTRNLKMNFSVDGGTEQSVSIGQHNPTLVVSNLPAGDHTITIKVAGAWKLGEMFVRDQTKQTVKGTA